MRSRLSSHGFTLLEVLLALVILSVAMSAITASAIQHTQHSVVLRDKTIASWVARNKMVEYQSGIEGVKKGKSKGKAEQAGRDWRWEANVTEIVESIVRIEISVSLASEEDTVLATLSGFLQEDS